MGAKTGPKGPTKDFDWNLLDSLVILRASELYVAERMLIQEGEEVNSRTIAAKVKLIQRRIKDQWDCNFVQYREQKSEKNKIRLMEKMLEVACDEGNPAMLIWLSKQLLGMTDKQEVKNETTLSAEATLTTKELYELEQKRRALDAK